MKSKIIVAHVGDSTAVLAKSSPDGKGKLQAIQLTVEHKPNLKAERARIEEAGGEIVFDGFMNHRVFANGKRYPGINMSRCLGDLWGHSEAGLTAKPDVLEYTLDADCQFVLICSD